MRQLIAVAMLAGLSVAAGDFDIAINEINYHLLGDDTRGEFIELVNAGTSYVDISRWVLEGGIQFEFPGGVMLAPGAFAVVAADPAYLAAEAGLSVVYGPWTGNLDNDGAVLILRKPDGVRADFVHYDDDDPWPGAPDGEGATLELRGARASNDLAWSWQASAYLGGTPGAANSAGMAAVRAVRINEIARIGATYWVELVRTGADPFALGSCTLARGADHAVRHTFAAATVQEFFATALGFEPPYGEDVYVLLGPDGKTLLDTCETRLTSASQSAGRYPDGADNVASFAAATWNAANLPAVADDIYISEIMYHPAHTGTPPVEPPGLQYVAIANRGAGSVDLSGWRFTKGIHFTFPEGTVLSAGSELVVARDAALLKSSRPTVPPSAVIGNFDGILLNSREKIILRDDLHNVVDAVRYGDDGYFPREADGGGAALCLRTSRRVENNCAQAWEAVAGGTPGVVPADRAIVPLVMEPRHDPPVPRSTEQVRVTCRVVDSDAVVSVGLRYQVNAGAATTVAMRDDGTGGDDVAGDGRYGVLIGPFADNALVSFHVLADDGDTAGVSTDAPGTGKDYLFLVDNDASPANAGAAYRVLMTAANWSTLTARATTSDVLLDATFIGDAGEVRYNAGVRYRGAGSRGATVKNYRVTFHDAERFRGIKLLNLNRQDTDSQHLAMDFLQRAGLPYSQEWMVNLWIHGAWDPLYMRIEAVDDDFCTRNFGEDGGALYRGLEPDDNGPSADFQYLGSSPDEYRPYYERVNGDWTHETYGPVIALCDAFDPARTPDAQFVQKLSQLIDVEEWAAFFAAQACLSNNEGNIAKSKGDDYFVYFRETDGRAVLIPWDLDTCFYSSSEVLFRPTVAAVRRFLTNPAFAPRYYAWLEKLMDGAFSRQECRARLALIKPQYTFGERDAIDSYWTARMGWLFEHVPRDVRGGLDAVSAQALVKKGDSWRYFEGTAAPSGGDLSWTQLGFNDAAWRQGPSGFGYADDDDATALDMEGNYSTVFVRRKFTVEAPLQALTLRVDYDDGFAAYLNGQLIGSRNAPTGTPLHTGLATGSHEAGTPVEIDATAYLGLLVAGENVLAVVGFNQTIGSSDFSLTPELLAGAGGAGGGCGALCYATAGTATFSGTAPVVRTRRVEIAGAPATYSYQWGTWEGTAAVAQGLNVVTVHAFDEDDALVDEYSFSVYGVNAFSTLQGTLTADRVITKAGSPYYLATAGLTVPAGRKLTIEPGVTILAGPAASILVLGRIEALGTASEPILFLGADCVQPWEGIGVRDTGIGDADPVHTLRWCTFRHGVARADFTGCVSPDNARLLLESCRFEDIRDNAVDGVGARLEIRSCVFEEIYEAVHCTDSQVLVSGCHFNGMIGDKDAIDLDFAVHITALSPDCIGSSRIENCFIGKGMDDGIDLGGEVAEDPDEHGQRHCYGTITVAGNVIVGVGDKAVSCEFKGDVWGTVVEDNVIARSGTGIAVKDGAVVEGFHNTITGCQEGLLVVSKTGAGDGGTGSFDSCISWGNRDDVVTDALSTFALTFSDAGGAAVWPGAGNIREDPAFVDDFTNDFRLLPGSPCAGTGSAGTDMGALAVAAGDAPFVRGDANVDDRIDLSDAVYVLLHLFRGRAVPCLDACDANDSGTLDIADAVFVLDYLYAHGAAPSMPFPSRGADTTADELTCER